MGAQGGGEGKTVHILVEEEAEIRTDWLRIGKQKGLAVMTYPNAEWFLDDLAHGCFHGDERFYLDQDMDGVRGVGLRLSRIIKERWSDAYTCLVTAYPKALFRRELREGAVDDVFGKYPSPFDNPAFTEIERRYEQEVWVPILNTIGVAN